MFYWYLVVGGGASGCVVAARLVETGKSVLLLGKGKLQFLCRKITTTKAFNLPDRQVGVIHVYRPSLAF